MANYNAPGSITTSSQAYLGIISICMPSTGVARRTKWYDVLIGSAATPADAYLQFDISRVTASSANGTTQTPGSNPLDAADAVSLAQIITNYTTASSVVTSSSSLWNIPINQRASYRWVAAPGSELVGPATAGNGLTLRVLNASAAGPTCNASVYYQEQ